MSPPLTITNNESHFSKLSFTNQLIVAEMIALIKVVNKGINYLLKLIDQFNINPCIGTGSTFMISRRVLTISKLLP